MNENLKNRRKLAYYINKWDDINLPYYEDYENIPEQVISFFKTESDLVYPAKTIFVAIIYAKCLEQYFDVPFYESLDDIELLFDDKYFNKYTYSQFKKGYDYILGALTDILNYPAAQKTIDYFKKEFLYGIDYKTDRSL